jgi:hypothetical protein
MRARTEPDVAPFADGVTPDVTLLLGGIGGIDSTQDSRCGSKGNRLDRSPCVVDTSVVWSRAHRQFLARHERADRGDKREDKLEALARPVEKPGGSI